MKFFKNKLSFYNGYKYFLICRESWEDGACREVCEETGLHITDVKFCHAVNTVVPEIDYHYVTIFMKGEVGDCGPKEPENKEPDKCEGMLFDKLLSNIIKS